MRTHDERVKPRVGGQVQSYRRRLAAHLTISIQRLAYSAERRRAPSDRLGDSRVDLLGRVSVEQAGEMEGDLADVTAALSDEAYPRVAPGDSVIEPIERAVLARLLLEGDERFEVRGELDLPPVVVRARVRGHDVGAVEHAHLGRGGDDDEGAADVGRRDRIVIPIETDLGRLSDLDDDALVGGEGIVGQRQELFTLLSEDVAHRASAVFGASSLRGDALCPGQGLTIEVLQVGVRAGGEEGVPDIANGALDAALGKSRQLLLMRRIRRNLFA